MYGKYWQFTRSDDYLNLLEQEKLGKMPIFKHITSPKDGKRKNAIHENAHNSRNRKFFSFFGMRKREYLLIFRPVWLLSDNGMWGISGAKLRIWGSECGFESVVNLGNYPNYSHETIQRSMLTAQP